MHRAQRARYFLQTPLSCVRGLKFFAIDLVAVVAGQRGIGKCNPVRRLVANEFAFREGDEFGFQRGRRLEILLQHDDGERLFKSVFILLPDDAAFAHGCVLDKAIFHLKRTHVNATALEQIVAAAFIVPIAVTVLAEFVAAHDPAAAQMLLRFLVSPVIVERGGWIVSGDKFRQDGDGYWYYEGRGDDLLKSGGIYVSPLEVENCLIQHAAVCECCVVGKKDEHGLEKPLAIIVLKENFKPSPALEAELIAFAKSNLVRYKAPHWIAFVDTALPRNDRDKVDRKKLKAAHA